MAEAKKGRALLLVLDSCGCGNAVDAAAFGDEGCNTLGHTAEFVKGLKVPALESLGLGNILPLEGVPSTDQAKGAFGQMRELSAGKDTTVGHWEMAGIVTNTPFKVFPEGFPQDIIDEFVQKTGRGVLGNCAASGTEIIARLGEEQAKTGDWIVYTSADSVFQIAAHEEVIPLDELYKACEIAREMGDRHGWTRVIARPYVGEPGAYTRTANRHDYSMPPTERTILDALVEENIPVIGVGKISDIFDGKGITDSIRTTSNLDGMAKATEAFSKMDTGLMFVNLIEFDSNYGHRRNPGGFAKCLEEFDEVLPILLKEVGENDLLMITADHGNDPTSPGSDHTRENVPILVYGPQSAAGKDLGVQDGFTQVANTIARFFGLTEEAWPGAGFYEEVSA